MARDALFDTAVNRALEVAVRLGVPLGERKALYRGLELWYLKTRFAYRVPFESVLGALLRYPEARGHYRWQGGAGGAWQEKP